MRTDGWISETSACVDGSDVVVQPARLQEVAFQFLILSAAPFLRLGIVLFVVVLAELRMEEGQGASVERWCGYQIALTVVTASL